MFNIVYSKNADIDLLDVMIHIEKTSQKNAINYLDRYEKKIALLQSNPEMGTYCSNKNIKRDCRVLIFESHIIIYTVDKDRNEIFILRIFHHSVNYQEKPL